MFRARSLRRGSAGPQLVRVLQSCFPRQVRAVTEMPRPCPTTFLVPGTAAAQAGPATEGQPVLRATASTSARQPLIPNVTTTQKSSSSGDGAASLPSPEIRVTKHRAPWARSSPDCEPRWPKGESSLLSLTTGDDFAVT